MQRVVKRNRFASGLAFVLALASLLFLLQVTPHGHANGQNEATCRLCQVAHIAIAPALPAATLTVPFMELRAVPLCTAGVASASPKDSSPSRAPPAIEL
jgi:hypothetical protein